MDPDPDPGEGAQREEMERLALMDRAWELGTTEESDYATQDGHGCGAQGSEGTQHKQPRQNFGLAKRPRLNKSVQDIFAEGGDLLSLRPERKSWTLEQSRASPEKAMALAEERVATLMWASRHVAQPLERAVSTGGTGGEGVGRDRGAEVNWFQRHTITAQAGQSHRRSGEASEA
ncbi:hypothetical protein CYMTET_21397 [Cymbomonas tetramitiformis]|uniref:Uncharacterized protein n=1 Tax=Cymbomonas tetramitiformis TaxID=36881 RepID=A0AAE0G2W9_9CHLO|nr:hypothetical protein CYMTET_21397 [Cymbomonas tetramitiformis]